MDVIRLVESLPPGYTGQVIGRQLLRSGASVGANYRAACRAKSVADFIAKMGIVEEEADECMHWMELLDETQLVPSEKLKALMAEADEIVAITVASIRTAKKNKSNADCGMNPQSEIRDEGKQNNDHHTQSAIRNPKSAIEYPCQRADRGR